MLRHLAKTALARTLYLTGADDYLGNFLGVRRSPLILAYHRVVKDFDAGLKTSLPAMMTSLKTFERQIDFLGRECRFVSLEEMGALLTGGSRLSRPAVAITFDDGYRDVYENAWPMLKRKGIPAAFFVVTDLVGTSRLQTHDKLYLLLRRGFSEWATPVRTLARLMIEAGVPVEEISQITPLCSNPILATPAILGALERRKVERLMHSIELIVGPEGGPHPELWNVDWDQLVEMQRGGVTIGSHTTHHVMLSNEDSSTMLREVSTSRVRLESGLGTPVKHFAYPNGRFNPSAVAAVAAAGYEFGYTICRHRDRLHPALTIPRKVFWERTCMDSSGVFSPAMMGCQMNRVFEVGARCGHRLRPVVELPETVGAIGTGVTA
jgi:peptidoglycan/xylan/chitin deacetylase (PgdA/CDA1 family)